MSKAELAILHAQQLSTTTVRIRPAAAHAYVSALGGRNPLTITIADFEPPSLEPQPIIVHERRINDKKDDGPGCCAVCWGVICGFACFECCCCGCCC